MATAGPYAAGTVATAISGTVDWTDPDNVKADDNSYAYVSFNQGVSETGAESSYLIKATNFNSGSFIPVGATVDGITVAVHRKSNRDIGATTYVRDSNVQLLKTSGVPGGSDDKAATGTNWPTTEATASYGGAADTWTAGLTYADVNSANFGMQLKCNGAWTVSNTPIGSIDYITITIEYTEVAVAGSRRNVGIL